MSDETPGSSDAQAADPVASVAGLFARLADCLAVSWLVGLEQEGGEVQLLRVIFGPDCDLATSPGRP